CNASLEPCESWRTARCGWLLSWHWIFLGAIDVCIDNDQYSTAKRDCTSRILLPGSLRNSSLTMQDTIKSE
ncbi:MAG: hypothetical protein ACWGMZ_11190, partial [Thermoguttaceae bacterium]